MKKTFVTLISFLFVLLTSACSDESIDTLRVGTNVWPGYEPLYLARALGILESDKVKLVEYPSASEVIRGFRNGNINAAALTLDEALLLQESGISTKIILITDFSEGGDAILAQKGISSFNELKDKAIGVEKNALGAFLLSRAIEMNQMSIEDVQIVNMEFNLHESSFLNREVEAVVTFEPIRTNLINKGANELFTSSDIPGEIVDVLLVRTDDLPQYTDHIEHLVNSWFVAIDHLDKEPMESAKIIDLRMKIGPYEVLKSYQGLRLPGREENQNLLSGAHPGLKSVLEKLQQVLVDNNLLKSKTNIGAMFIETVPGLDS